MISRSDFMKKQLIVVFTYQGEVVSFRNDNIVVTDSDGSLKLQTTCYRVFALFIIGHVTVTSVMISKAHKFGFPIYLMTTSFKTIDIIGHETQGNVRLRQKQYEVDGLPIGKHLIENKIDNQVLTLKAHRTNDWALVESISKMESIKKSVPSLNDVRSVMGAEGMAAKIYFSQQFDLSLWSGRRPRVKTDFINSTLDIGYTMLFNIVDAFLRMYGFDTYKGVLHTYFYMRKSLVCDLVEPFRPIIDRQVRKSINLGQCKSDAFNQIDGRYLLSIDHQKEYTAFLTQPFLKHREEMFLYFQSYYRSFDRDKDPSDYPVFKME